MIPQCVPTKMTFAIAGVMAIGADARPRQALERLFVDGVELTPEASLTVRSHSPAGLAWGYSGRGAAQTALAICLHIFGSSAVAEAIYQDFKNEFVRQWPLAKPFNQQIDITNFVLDHWQVITEAYETAPNELPT